MEKNSQGEKIFFTIIALCVFIAGSYVILEPNVRGIHGYKAFNTFGRLIGWIMVNSGYAILSIYYKSLVRLNFFVFRERPQWKIFILGFFFIAFFSGIFGFVTGKCYGIEHVDEIRGGFLRMLEGIYVVSAVVAYSYYRKYKISINHFMNDIFSQKNKGI